MAKNIREQNQIKDFMISFIRGKKYLYFPFGKYNEGNIFTTLNDENYQNNTKNKEGNIKLDNKQSKMILEKKKIIYTKLCLLIIKEIDFRI